MMRTRTMRACAILPVAWVLLAAVSARPLEGAARAPAAGVAGADDPLAQVAFQPHAGSALPLDGLFRDERGQLIRFGDCFDGHRPVLLTFAWLRCPNLCSTALDDLAARLRAIGGEKYALIVLDIDPREDPTLAAAKKRALLGSAEPEAGRAWHFLTGEEPAIRRIAAAAGFRYAWDERSRQFAHATGVLILTPAGRVSGASFGLGDSPQALAAALRAATRGDVVGSGLEDVVLRCFHLDANGPHSALVLAALRGAGVLVLVGLLLLTMVLSRRVPRGGKPVSR